MSDDGSPRGSEGGEERKFFFDDDEKSEEPLVKVEGISDEDLHNASLNKGDKNTEDSK